MKKNNKFRNNGNSNAYSLNYKFDSVSPAGKVSGTALDLIKKYNELAKEAHGSGDYVEMEVYRQYAEHYRKIVTEINERKNYRQEQANNQAQAEENAETSENVENNNQTDEKPSTDNNVEPIVQTPMPIRKKTFKMIEIKPSQAEINNDTTDTATEEKPETVTKTKRVIRRKKVATDDNLSQSEAI